MSENRGLSMALFLQFHVMRDSRDDFLYVTLCGALSILFQLLGWVSWDFFVMLMLM